MKDYRLTSELTKNFLEHLRIQERSPATCKKYARFVADFAHYCAEKTVTKQVVLSYKQVLLSRGYCARSINCVLAALNSLFAFLSWHELHIKSMKIQKQIYCPEERELTRAEYERLCRAAEHGGNVRLLLALQTLCATGIRVSELRFITVEAVRRGVATVTAKGKTREVFLVKPLKKKLLRYCAAQGLETGWVFVTRTGRPLNRTNLWREMKRLCSAARVDARKVYPHNLRHLFARVFYNMENDIAKLADLLGHSSIETTRIYIISTGAEHRRRMERMRLIL